MLTRHKNIFSEILHLIYTYLAFQSDVYHCGFIVCSDIPKSLVNRFGEITKVCVIRITDRHLKIITLYLTMLPRVMTIVTMGCN